MYRGDGCPRKGEIVNTWSAGAGGVARTGIRAAPLRFGHAGALVPCSAGLTQRRAAVGKKREGRSAGTWEMRRAAGIGDGRTGSRAAGLGFIWPRRDSRAGATPNPSQQGRSGGPMAAAAAQPQGEAGEGRTALGSVPGVREMHRNIMIHLSKFSL